MTILAEFQPRPLLPSSWLRHSRTATLAVFAAWLGATGLWLSSLSVLQTDFFGLSAWLLTPLAFLSLGSQLGWRRLATGLEAWDTRSVSSPTVEGTPIVEREVPALASEPSATDDDGEQALRQDLRDLGHFTEIAERQIDLVCRETENAANDILSRVNHVEAAVRGTVEYLREATGSARVVQVIEESEASMGNCQRELAEVLAERERDADMVARRMSEIKAQAADLEGLIGDVRRISAQTNMLAINAAIEAVHAGDVGKGFAVIAREIKDLSASVDRIAMSISSGVRDLRTGVEEAFRTTVEDRVEAERAVFGSIGEAINRLTGNLERLIAHQRDTIVKVCRENEEIEEPIIELAACVQFQDIARQQLLQLKRAWRSVNDHLVTAADASTTAGSENGSLSATIASFYDDYVRAEQRDAHAGSAPASSLPAIELF